MNKSGMAFILNLIFIILGIIIFVALIPAIVDVGGNSRGCSYLNCDGYVDAGAVGDGCTSANQSYSATSNLESNQLGCIALDIFPGILIIGVLGIMLYFLMRGKMDEPQQQTYNPYGGY